MSEKSVTEYENASLGAANSPLDIALMHHKSTGWTYAASGFLPGNSDICRKTVDQALAGNAGNDKDGAYKRIGLNTFVDGDGPEGVIIQIITGANNTLQTLDLLLDAVSEKLSI